MSMTMTPGSGSAGSDTSFFVDRETFLVDLRDGTRLAMGEGRAVDGGRRLLARFLRGGAAQGSPSLSREGRLRGLFPLLEEQAGSRGSGSEHPLSRRWLGSRLQFPTSQACIQFAHRSTTHSGLFERVFLRIIVKMQESNIGLVLEA